MDMNQLLRTKKKATYKVVIFRYIFLFAALLLLMFGSYTFYDYQGERQENAAREAQNTANRIVSQNDERLQNLRQYYVTMASNDSIEWMLDNDIQYSDYSNYKSAYEDMSSLGIFGDYIKSFTFANFKTGWVLSNKGMFPIDEAYNKEMLTDIYERKTDLAVKNYWSMDSGIEIENPIDRRYRVTVETNGLNFIMNLPFSSYNTYAVFIANINMDTWKSWMQEWLAEYEEIVVLGQDGELIYSTNDGLVSECIQMLQQKQNIRMLPYEGVDYTIASAQSDILGWNYYVIYDIAGGQADIKLPIAILSILFVLIIICFVLVSNLIYMPINTLIKNVSEVDGKRKIEGNELEYLAGSFRNLKQDKQALEGLLYQQQDKLQELFELRLIHGEVEAEEWDEYLEGFKLQTRSYFATVVVILNLRDEEVQSMVNEDAICLKILQEMPESLKSKAWMPPIYNASAIFAIFTEDDEDALLDKIREFYDEMQDYAKSVCDYHIIMGVSATHRNYHHIRAAYRESIHALSINNEMIISSDEQEENDNLGAQKVQDCRFYLASTTVLGNDYNQHFEEEIQAAVKAVDKKQCYEVTDAFSRYLSQSQASSEAHLVYILRYVNTILLTAVEAEIDLSELYPDGMKKIYRELLEVTEYDRVRRYIKWKFIDPVMKKRTEYLENHSYSIIEEIEKLIAERHGNLSLTECADILGVHQTYIWKVLKMERGKSFSDYIEEYKLSEAKRLLLESDLTVAEISEQLGYTNAQNFIRFFSKSTGVTPGKFRKLY